MSEKLSSSYSGIVTIDISGCLDVTMFATNRLRLAYVGIRYCPLPLFARGLDLQLHLLRYFCAEEASDAVGSATRPPWQSDDRRAQFEP
jgi:hypothetical protein